MGKKEEIEELIGRVLDGTELEFRIDRYTVTDDLETGEVTISCDLHHAKTGDKKSIEGRGVGVVDAFFQGMVNLYSEKYPSLTTLRFSAFSVDADINSGRQSARSDSMANIVLRVANSEGREYEFSDSSPSLTRSVIRAVLRGVEFFINGERAFIDVYRALQHAREENRNDSVQSYTAQLATLVESTSYSEVIEQIKSEESLN